MLALTVYTYGIATLLQFTFISGFQTFFELYIRFNLLTIIFSQKVLLIYLFSVFYHESLTLTFAYIHGMTSKKLRSNYFSCI